MKKIYSYTLIALALLTLCSCSKKFLDVDPTVINNETFYTDEEKLLNGLAGVYGAISSEYTYGNYYSIMMSNVDDLSYFNRASTTIYIQVYRHDASSSQNYYAWAWFYKGIRNANSFMNVVDNQFPDSEVAKEYRNEARFLRAFYHFILAQGWGDVPLRDTETTSKEQTNCAASPQATVLKWVADEMEACLESAPHEVDIQPSRVTWTTMKGILARVYLFLAYSDSANAKSYYKLAMDHAKDVIDSGLHQLNPDYSQVFINMIEDEYDTEYHESMWEAEFKGDRSSASAWTNGRIGDVLGLQSSGSSNYSSFNCNYAYGQYNGSLKLWDLYWQTDRTDDENATSNISDARQYWNMCPYNYTGNDKQAPYGSDGTGSCKASIDKTPYVYNNVSTRVDETVAVGQRNCGKFRREVIYEGVKDAKRLYTTINYPILRYADVLLMYAEAANEYNGAPTQEAYDALKLVRDRAGIQTKDFSEYSDYASFQSLVRNERGRELVFESLRKYDLIRWGIFVKEMNNYSKWAADERWSKNATAGYAAAIGDAVQEKHIVYPVPSIELGVNKDLVQNPLW